MTKIVNIKNGGISMGGVITYEDSERIRTKLGMNKNEFFKLLKVSKSTYYLWKQMGVSGTAGQLLRVLEDNSEIVLKTLM